MFRKKINSFLYHWQYGGIYRIAQKAAERLLYYFYPLLSPSVFLNIKMSIYAGYLANVKQPRSFSEKVGYNKLFNPNPLASTVTDKYKVRAYVEEKVGASVLNETYWVGTEPKEIPFDSLPNTFVLKANHGAGLNYFVSDKKSMSITNVIESASLWMSMTYSEQTRSYETQYDDIEHCLLIEKFMHDEVYGQPLDYKFFCFAGEPEYIQVDIDRFDKHRRNIYDKKWNLAPFELHYRSGGDVEKPVKLQEMIDIARALSSDFEFCRVDLYLLNNKDIIFGEITLYPGGGYERFFPKSWDFELGKLWTMSASGNLKN